MTTKNRAIAAARDSQPISHSEHLAAPFRGSSRIVRRVSRQFNIAVYFVLRPFAHWAKPMMLRFAQKPAARKWVIRVFGRHSRLVNTARLFLIGVPTSSPPVEAPSPEMLAESESLSARGRDILSTLVEMRAQAKGEMQRASRT